MILNNLPGLPDGVSVVELLASGRALVLLVPDKKKLFKPIGYRQAVACTNKYQVLIKGEDGLVAQWLPESMS